MTAGRHDAQARKHLAEAAAGAEITGETAVTPTENLDIRGINISNCHAVIDETGRQRSFAVHLPEAAIEVMLVLLSGMSAVPGPKFSTMTGSAEEKVSATRLLTSAVFTGLTFGMLKAAW